MNATKNPLAVMADAILLMQVSGYALSANDTRQARAAVAELVAAARLVANYRSSGDAVAEAAIKRAQFVRLRAALAKFQS